MIVVIGSDANRRDCNKAHFGVDGNDIRSSRDGPCKTGLENVHYVLRELYSNENCTQMMYIAGQILPPSQGYVVVGEAVWLLYTNCTDNPRLDPTGISAASWRQIKKLLLQPRTLLDTLTSRKRGCCSSKFYESVLEYTLHAWWPRDKERKDHPILHLLAYYVEQWCVVESITIVKGGVPDESEFRTLVKGVVGVVPVLDGCDAVHDLVVPKITPQGGWRNPTILVIRHFLSEVRMLKKIVSLNDHTFQVCAYRCGAVIYLDAYDNDTSQVYMVTVEDAAVPGLLVPNAYGIEHNIDNDTPATPEAVYHRLIDLLAIEHASKNVNARRQLLCHRRYNLLCKMNTRIDGYRVRLKCYAGALGELYCTVYMFDECATITLMIEEKIRHRLFSKCDDTLERPVIEDEDARKILTIVVDRLRISPSKGMKNCIDESTRKHDYRVCNKNQHSGDASVNTQAVCPTLNRITGGELCMKKVRTALAAKAVTASYRQRSTMVPHRNPWRGTRYGNDTAVTTDATQGFSLTIRCNSYAGKILFRKVVSFGKVSHVLTIRHTSSSNMLLVHIYEPRSSRTLLARGTSAVVLLM